MKHSIFAALAVLTIFFGSCAGTKNTSDNKSTDLNELTGNKWQLIELNGKTIEGKLNNKMPYLEFLADESRYVATGGCNTMNGTYNFTGKNNISFKSGISTMMACDDMETDRLLAQVFVKSNNFTLIDGELSLNHGKTALAKFKKVDAENNLTGTWELDYIANASIPFNELYPNKKPFISFESGSKKVSGNGGCNNFNTTMDVQGKNIKFGPIASTRMACPGEGEPLFFQSLEKVNVQSVNDNSLTLIVGDIAIMRFQKKEAQKK